MRELLGIIEDISIRLIDHYGDILKGIIIGGEGIEGENDELPVFLLIILDNTRRISFLARQEIGEYFYKKVEREEVFFEYVKKRGHRPLLYFLVIDPTELEFHIPFVNYILNTGKVLYNKIELEKVNFLKVGKVYKFAEIDKGDVVEL